MEPTTLNLEDLVPISMIRAHTKTNDVPQVTDDQLALYRAAAIEQAEIYTGLVWSGQRVITQAAETPAFRNNFRRSRKLRLDYPTSDGIINLYGSYAKHLDRIIYTDPGSIVVKIPIVQEAIDVSDCCNPCGRGAENFGLRLMYRTGLSSIADVPKTLILGALKYIAHVIENPGDNVVASSVSGSAQRQGISVAPAANPAWASGAIEMWRTLRKDLM